MIDRRATEQASPRYRDLDAWHDAEILAALWEAQAASVAAVRPVLAAIAAAATAAAARLGDAGRLFYAGAGTSGRIGAQDAAELAPTFGWPESRMLVLLAGGIAALAGSVEGAEDDIAAARALIGEHSAGRSDVVVGIAASGATPFTLACIETARHAGALTVGVANAPGAPLLLASEHPILLDTGAEPLAGSTRLKAGTAQKIVVNLFSTLLMVRRGHVHDGLMVNMRPSNAKLRDRSERMVMQLGGCDASVARAALEASDGNVKRAVLRLRGLGMAQADALLTRHGGRLRGALAEIGQ